MKVLRTVAALLVLGCTCALGDFSARPAFHYSPPQGWINDPMLVVSNNSFHVLIDCDPSSVLPPWAPGSNSSYCHATSSDMVNWQAQPVAETAARGTGSLLAADDLTAAARAALPAGTAAVLFQSGGFASTTASSSLSGFSLLRNQSLITLPPSVNATMVGDVYVTTNGSMYRMIVSSGLRTGVSTSVPLLLLYVSADLVHWNFSSVLYQGEAWCGPRAECANYFELDGSMVVIMSCPATGQSVWMVGSETNGVFAKTNNGTVDGGLAYAAGTFVDKDTNRRIVMLWVHDGLTAAQQAQAGFANLLSVPREVSLTATSRLQFQPIAELSNYEEPPLNFFNVEVDHGTYQLSLPPGLNQQFRLKVSWTIKAAGDPNTIAVDFLQAPDNSEVTSLESTSAGTCEAALENNTDHAGGDIKGIPVSGSQANVQWCQNECCQTQGCVGFVYVTNQPGDQGPYCWLKSQWMPSAPLQVATSGLIGAGQISLNATRSSIAANVSKPLVKLGWSVTQSAAVDVLVDRTVVELFSPDYSQVVTVPVHPQNPASTGFQLRADNATVIFNVQIYPVRSPKSQGELHA